MLLKKIKYGFYMAFVRIKGFKYQYIKKFKGEEAANKYAGDSIRLWSKFTIDIIGIDLEVEGKENIPEGPCVFIGNHTSILDIPVVYYASNKNIGFIAKKEILKTPILGYWLKKANCIPLDRENTREAIKAIAGGVENLKNGYSMMIFPEGTRSKDGKVGEFKKGSLKLATKAKVPVVPVAIDGAFKSFEKEREFKPSKIKIIFSKPIETKSLTREEEKTLSGKIRDIIISNLSD